jgi:cytochrome P450
MGAYLAANLLNNAILCLIENPDQLRRLRATPDLELPFIGSANRHPQQFPDPNDFNIACDPNPHIASGTASTSAWAGRSRAWRRGSLCPTYWSG